VLVPVTAAILTGLTTGLLYGLLGFAIVALFKMTGVANFAAGSIATLGAAVALKASQTWGLSTLLAVLLAIAATAAAGVIAYWLVMRFRDDVDHLSLTVRTVGLFLLAQGLLEKWLGPGQPFAFPALLPDISLTVSGVRLASSTLLFPVVAAVCLALFGIFFRFTRTGLLMRGMASDVSTATLLGADTRRLSAAAWGLTAGLAAVVGVLAAPSQLVSSDMLTSWLLFVFAGVVIGGLTSLVGAVVGGVIVGVVQGVAYQLAGNEVALLAVFALFLLTLQVMPQGIFGRPTVERL